MIDPLIVALAFGTIFLVELPDKTFVATLVLSTRFRPLLVWMGVGLAFAVQTGIAVGLGTAAAQLPVTAVRVAAALLFLAGGLWLLREARGADAEEPATEREFAERAGGPKHGLAVVGTSFVVLFTAEWGDLSQLLTLSLVARYDDPLGVYLGAWAALLAVSGLAALLGRALLRRIRLATLHRVGGTVCLLLAAATIVELVR